MDLLWSAEALGSSHSQHNLRAKSYSCQQPSSEIILLSPLSFRGHGLELPANVSCCSGLSQQLPSSDTQPSSWWQANEDGSLGLCQAWLGLCPIRHPAQQKRKGSRDPKLFLATASISQAQCKCPLRILYNPIFPKLPSQMPQFQMMALLVFQSTFQGRIQVFRWFVCFKKFVHFF